MTTIEAARTRLVTLLGAVTATVGSVTYTVKRVHEYPPASIPPGEQPCFVIALPDLGEPPEIESSVRYSVYTMRVGLFLQDADPVQAGKALDAFRKSVIAKFDSAIAWDDTADIAIGPTVSTSQERFAGLDYPHIEFGWQVHVSEVVTVGP